MQREADERSEDEEQERAASGHARDVDSEDAVDRVDARLRHRATHPDAVGGRADDRRGIAVSSAAADARQAMGVGRVEDFREQPASALLHAHDRREEAARRRGIAILPDVRRDHARDENDIVQEGSVGSVLRRLLFFFQRNQFDRDLEDELRFHEEMKARALADADGMSGDEARAAAQRRIGNRLRLREQSREPWTFATVDTFAQDARHALRLMRRDPAFTFTALAALALGIGLNTAIVSVAYGVLWRPLPYPHPDRLVIVPSAQQTETGARTFWTWAPVSYEALRPRVT